MLFEWNPSTDSQVSVTWLTALGWGFSPLKLTLKFNLHCGVLLWEVKGSDKVIRVGPPQLNTGGLVRRKKQEYTHIHRFPVLIVRPCVTLGFCQQEGDLSHEQCAQIKLLFVMNPTCGAVLQQRKSMRTHPLAFILSMQTWTWWKRQRRPQHGCGTHLDFLFLLRGSLGPSSNLGPHLENCYLSTLGWERMELLQAWHFPRCFVMFLLGLTVFSWPGPLEGHGQNESLVGLSCSVLWTLCF